MSLLTETWRQLVRHRLWPVALLLVGALVAVPVLLAKSPEPAAPAPTPSAEADAGDVLAEPVVAQVADGTQTRRRHVLGASKDPFQPAPPAKVKGSSVPKVTTSGIRKVTTPRTTTVGGGTSVPVGGSFGGGSGTPVSPPVGGPVTPAPPKRTYPADSLTVRFGDGDLLPKSVLRVGEALPEETAEDENPLLAYVGLTRDGKQAKFLVDASVVADGDGHCDSDGGGTCDTLYLRAGETEFFDVTDEEGNVAGQFQLDIVAIHTKKRASAARAAKTAKAARSARAHVAALPTAAVGKSLTGLAGVARLLQGL